MHVENINKELGFMKSILIVSSVHVYTITMYCQYNVAVSVSLSSTSKPHGN